MVCTGNLILIIINERNQTSNLQRKFKTNICLKKKKLLYKYYHIILHNITNIQVNRTNLQARLG